MKRSLFSVLRLPQLLIFSLLLAMSLTFTACGGGDDVLESDELEEGVGGEEADD
jgi:hypothetical protein